MCCPLEVPPPTPPARVAMPSVAALVAAAAAPAATVSDAAPKKLRRAMSFGGGGSEKCHRCRMVVYAAEKATVRLALAAALAAALSRVLPPPLPLNSNPIPNQAQGNTFHQACFRCTECNTKLTASSWCVDSGGRLFCKAHFLQLLRAGGGDYSLGGTKETL